MSTSLKTLAFAIASLAVLPAYADTITGTETGFRDGGTLQVTFTGTPENNGTYQLNGLTAATATFTVGNVVQDSLNLSNLISFTYKSSSDFNFAFESATDVIEGGAFGGGSSEGVVGSRPNDKLSSSSYTVTITPTTPPPAITPEPSSIALLGTGLLGIAGMLKRRLA